MNPKELYIVIKQDTQKYWTVHLNGVRAAKYKNEKNAEQYIEDVKEMNQDRKITVLDGEDIELKPSDFLPVD